MIVSPKTLRLALKVHTGISFSLEKCRDVISALEDLECLSPSGETKVFSFGEPTCFAFLSDGSVLEMQPHDGQGDSS